MQLLGVLGLLPMATDDFFRARLTFPGNPYDGHTLAAQIEQTATLLQDLEVKPTTAVVDLGYRGVDHLVPVQVVHRGRAKTMSAQQRRSLKRRQAIAPVIGRLKADHGMRRCWLKGGEGDALNAVLCAAGFNIRWLLRAIARLGLRTLLLALIEWPPHAASTPTARTGLLRRFGAVVHELAQRLTTRRQLPAAIGR